MFDTYKWYLYVLFKVFTKEVKINKWKNKIKQNINDIFSIFFIISEEKSKLFSVDSCILKLFYENKSLLNVSVLPMINVKCILLIK